MIGDDLQYMGMTSRANTILAAGYDDGTIYFERSDDKGVTTTTLRNGTTRAAIADGDPQQPAIIACDSGEILVVLAKGETLFTYLSEDGGETWRHVTR